MFGVKDTWIWHIRCLRKEKRSCIGLQKRVRYYILWNIRGKHTMNTFAEVLKTQTRNLEIPIEELCEGLCSQSMFARICNGERSADKLLREHLMQRLGISDTRNESFLFRDEYDMWKLRQQMVNSMNREQYKRVEGLLQEYKGKASMENPLEQQFCLVMEVQLLMAQGCGEQQIKERIERALKLTVPNIDTKSLHQLLLSEQEMDLVLEYARYCHPKRMVQCCEALLEYVKQHIHDEYLKAKIFPKIVYYQCIAEGEESDLDMLLQNCNEAIECLRDTQRLYYFWELLCEREKIYEYFIKKASADSEKTQKQVFVLMQEENALWKRTLEEMYRDCGVSPAMKNSCYLYLQKDTFCINEIIFKRRTMLGMTRKELCEGICSEKTIARVELTNGKMQMPIARRVLRRLGLSVERQRVDVVTSNPEALKLVKDIATYGYNREYEKEQAALEKLEKMIPMEEPINRQYVKETRAMIEYNRGKVSGNMTLSELGDALACTIPIQIVENAVELFITVGEITCLMNMAYVQGNEEMNTYYEILWRICKQYEERDEIAQNISMYEFMMAHIASVLGNTGRYEESNAISPTIIRENALARRFGNIADGIYNMAYNYKAQCPPDYDDKVWRTEVEKSAMLFHIAKVYNLERLLENKLREN